MNDVIELGGRAYENGIVLKKRFGISDSTLCKWTAIGILPQGLKIGRSRYYARDEVDERLKERGQAA
jgi:hypothetical protein